MRHRIGVIVLFQIDVSEIDISVDVVGIERDRMCAIRGGRGGGFRDFQLASHRSGQAASAFALSAIAWVLWRPLHCNLPLRFGGAKNQRHSGIIRGEAQSLRTSGDSGGVIVLFRGVHATLLRRNGAVGLRRADRCPLSQNPKSE